MASLQSIARRTEKIIHNNNLSHTLRDATTKTAQQQKKARQPKATWMKNQKKWWLEEAMCRDSLILTRCLCRPPEGFYRSSSLALAQTSWACSAWEASSIRQLISCKQGHVRSLANHVAEGPCTCEIQAGPGIMHSTGSPSSSYCQSKQSNQKQALAAARNHDNDSIGGS